MNINQLKQFICVAGENNISRAAEKLHISQQALSKSLGLLEKEWNISLFRRGNLGTELTDAGRQILPVVESMIQSYTEHERIIETILKAQGVTLHMAVENSSVLNDFPTDLLYSVGNLRIVPHISKGITQCMSSVINGTSDFALVSNPPQVEDVAFVELVNRTPHAVVYAGHTLASREVLTLTELQHERHIWFSEHSSAADAYIKSCIRSGFYPRIVASYPSVEMIIQAVQNHEGITVGYSTRLVADQTPGVYTIPINDPSLVYRMGILVRLERMDDIRITSFINAAKTLF